MQNRGCPPCSGPGDAGTRNRRLQRRVSYFKCQRKQMDLIRILFAILLPPLGVFLQVGFAGAFWLNILLTLLGYIPGIVHAVWIIVRR